MKVLLSCYACSPYKGSEPGMGWNFVKCLSRLHKLYIITESKFKLDIERYFEEHPDENRYFHFYFIEKNRHKTFRKIWPPSYYWFYNVWQKKAYKLAATLDKKENFDVIHQLNMVGYREPGYLWNLSKPFVWGPIGGFDITPWQMLPSMGLKGCTYYSFRNVINLWQMHTSKRVRIAMKRADAIISATQSQHDFIHQLYDCESTIISEVGLLESQSASANCRQDGEPLRICWSGQHTPGKALNLLLKALALSDRDDLELHVLGEGTESGKWKKLANNLGLQKIVWHGWVDKDWAHQIMKSCHLLCITSLKDLTSTVLLEGLSYSLPVIALDHCGFSNVITEECGRKIPVINAKQVVLELSHAINELADDEPLRRRLAKGALFRAQKFNWEDKAKTITGIYESVSV